MSILLSVQLLKQRDKNSSQEWLNKLPQMVKQLEVSLYRSAPSFDAYSDKSTLKHRLQLLAMEIAKKTHSSGIDEGVEKQRENGNSVNNHSARPQDQQHPPPPMSQPQHLQTMGYPSSQNGSSSNSRTDGIRGPMNTPRNPRMDPPNVMPNPMYNWQRHPRNSDQATVHSESSNSNKPQVVNLGEINNMMGPGSMPPTPAVSSSNEKNGPGSSGNSKGSENEWEVRIRHKQQRLLLLHHSSKCQNADGKCPVTPHCADMKRLWLHMAKCEDNRCSVSHCYSSRAILSHYRKCKDPNCRACGPVRETVWKSRNSRPKGGGPSGDSTPSRDQANDAMSMPKIPPPKIPPATQSQMPALTSSMPPLAPSSNNVPQAKDKASFKRVTESSTESSRSSTEVDPKIKHKQQRLLLLRHASKCTAKEGECRKTPHCAEMKKLWKHISECHDNKCKYPHCLSSRYVLMHYRKCKDSRCPACAPVRETIRQGASSSPLQIQPADNPNKKRKDKDGAPAPVEVKLKPQPGPSQQSDKEEDHSFSIVNNFTIEQIELHLQSLKQTYKLPVKVMKERCLSVLKTLQEHEHYWVFSKPVDPDELGLPDYFDVIKKPMDLGTVQKKLDQGQYHSISDFNCDIKLTFDNALTYNEKGSVVNQMATEMKEQYEKKYESLLQLLRKEEADRMKNHRTCTLCGFEKLQFEPPVFFCNSLKCPSKRIRRNTHFYSSGNNQYHYCSQCFNDLDDNAAIELPDMTLKKVNLKKKKNDETHEENWVQCDVCQRWIHQICGLFNTRQNKDNKSTYSCPKCLLGDRKKGKNPGRAKAPTAQELPRTKLSEWIEGYIGPKVKKHYKVLAQEKSEVEVSCPFFLF